MGFELTGATPDERLKELTEKFHKLQAVRVHICAQQIDADIDGVAHQEH